MKYLRFCIFLFILSTIVSVYPNEELQSFRLLDNTNVTLENGVPKYTTYCYDEINCTNIITFYPDSNPNPSAIIEVGTKFSNYTISFNTSYTVHDSNVELMPFTLLYPVGQYGYQIIKIFVINLTSETSIMNVWDAMDHVTRRCEVASGGIPPSSGPECKINLQCLAYLNCINSNSNTLSLSTRANEQLSYISSHIVGIYRFLMTYIMIIPYAIGLLFSVLNVVLFIQLKSLKSPFIMFVAIQSFYCIFWFLCFFLFTAFYSRVFGKSLLGLQLNLLIIGSNKSIQIEFSMIPLSLMYLCSFGIEAIRFFKALSRVFALRFPLWSSGIIAWVFVILSLISKYIPELPYPGPVISICGGRNPNFGTKNVLYIVFGWDCFPQYILYDELCPLNLITLLLDCYVFFLLKRSKLNDQQKKREKVLKLFIVMDLIEVFYSCFRRMILFVYLHNTYNGYVDFSSQWSMFYDNAFARYIIFSLYEIDRFFFYMIRLIFYAAEMVVCQVLMRRIQTVENPHDVPRNFVDRFLLKFTKKFYTRVLRVQPTIITNSTNIAVARS